MVFTNVFWSAHCFSGPYGHRQYFRTTDDGPSLGMSTMVVFLSLLIWGWLLGPVGMLLSVPLTSVCKIWMETTKGGSKLAILLGPGRPKSRLPG